MIIMVIRLSYINIYIVYDYHYVNEFEFQFELYNYELLGIPHIHMS